MTDPRHRALAEQWWTMTIAQQLGNIGSEISRASTWTTRNPEIAQAALYRALDLFDLTLDDPRHRRSPARLREIARAREVVVDFFAGVNEYHSTAAGLQKVLRRIRAGRAVTPRRLLDRGLSLWESDTRRSSSGKGRKSAGSARQQDPMRHIQSPDAEAEVSWDGGELLYRFRTDLRAVIPPFITNTTRRTAVSRQGDCRRSQRDGSLAQSS